MVLCYFIVLCFLQIDGKMLYRQTDYNSPFFCSNIFPMVLWNQTTVSVRYGHISVSFLPGPGLHGRLSCFVCVGTIIASQPELPLLVLRDRELALDMLIELKEFVKCFSFNLG